MYFLLKMVQALYLAVATCLHFDICDLCFTCIDRDMYQISRYCKRLIKIIIFLRLSLCRLLLCTAITPSRWLSFSASLLPNFFNQYVFLILNTPITLYFLCILLLFRFILYRKLSFIDQYDIFIINILFKNIEHPYALMMLTS